MVPKVCFSLVSLHTARGNPVSTSQAWLSPLQRLGQVASGLKLGERRRRHAFGSCWWLNSGPVLPQPDGVEKQSVHPSGGNQQHRRSVLLGDRPRGGIEVCAHAFEGGNGLATPAPWHGRLTPHQSASRLKK